jgi:thiamine biosynthesis lipoprotein
MGTASSVVGGTAPAVMRRVLVPQTLVPRSVPREATLHTSSDATMGTTWSAKWIAAREAPRAAIERAIQRELDLVVAQMSTWEPASDLARFNRAPAASWHTIPEAFAEVLACALDVARDSGGVFDPCAGALIDAWGFGPHGRWLEADFMPPDATCIDAARAFGGRTRLQFDRDRRRLHQPGGLRLDFSAIAKGHAVDRIALALHSEFGLDNQLVEVGGELRGQGAKPDGQPWWVQLASPRDDDTAGTWVALHGLSVATSGDDQRVFVRDGVRHPHTIDPRSGRPIGHGVCAVSVLHASCMWADALSTALTVLGPAAGRPWAEARGIAALWTTRRRDGGFDETMTSACAALAD